MPFSEKNLPARFSRVAEFLGQLLCVIDSVDCAVPCTAAVCWELAIPFVLSPALSVAFFVPRIVYVPAGGWEPHCNCAVRTCCQARTAVVRLQELPGIRAADRDAGVRQGCSACVSSTVPCAVVPLVATSGDGVRVPKDATGARPVPVRVTFSDGFTASFELMVTDSVNVVAEFGLNLTLMEQLASPARVPVPAGEVPPLRAKACDRDAVDGQGFGARVTEGCRQKALFVFTNWCGNGNVVGDTAAMGGPGNRVAPFSSGTSGGQLGVPRLSKETSSR